MIICAFHLPEADKMDGPIYSVEELQKELDALEQRLSQVDGQESEIQKRISTLHSKIKFCMRPVSSQELS